MGLLNCLMFDDISSWTYGFYIDGQAAFNAPARRGESVKVPGRNGTLFLDEDTFDNITVEYTVFFAANSDSDFAEQLAGFRAALMSKRGYLRLTDTYHPEEFRMAVYKSGLEVDPVQYKRAGEFKLEFDCKPQRFLLEGDANHPITVSNGGRIPNNTQNVANPRITVSGSGSGSIRVGDRTVSFTNLTNSGITVDCEMQECYTGTTSQNSNVTMTDGFPKVPPGGATLIYDGGITSVRVVLNTWIL